MRRRPRVSEHPDFEELDQIPHTKPLPARPAARFMCVPTTSGTASEVSAPSSSPMTSWAASTGLGDMEMMPTSPSATRTSPGMPPHVTAETGMDALTRVGSARPQQANYVSTSLPPAAALDIVRWLPRAYRDGDVAREMMGRCVHDGGPCLHERRWASSIPHGADHRWLLPSPTAAPAIPAALHHRVEQQGTSGRGCYEGLAARWRGRLRAGRARPSTRFLGILCSCRTPESTRRPTGELCGRWRRTLSEMDTEDEPRDPDRARVCRDSRKGLPRRLDGPASLGMRGCIGFLSSTTTEG